MTDEFCQGFLVCCAIIACLFMGYFLGVTDVESEIEACFKRNIPISECDHINGWTFVTLVKDKDVKP